MRTVAVTPSLITLLLFAGINVAQAGESVYQKDACQKGCSAHRDGHWCHHCKDDRGSRGAASRDLPTIMSRAPVGAIVESMPVIRAVPSLVSMPMMAGIPVSRPAAGTCDTEDARLDELDARVEALHLRMVTIQRSIELQTKILEELSANGSIGGTRLPGLP